MDPVHPDVHVVDLGQRRVGEPFALVLPLLGQPGDHRRRQARRGAEELLQRRGEVLRAHPVQVHQRQHLGHLRADLRHHGGMIELRNRRRSPVASSTRRSFTRGASTSTGPAPVTIGARLGVTVADHQTLAVLVELVDERRHVGVDLRLQRHGQHPPGALADQSHPDPSPTPRAVRSSATTLNIGVPSSPGRQPRQSRVFSEEGTSRPRTVVHPQVLVITRGGQGRPSNHFDRPRIAADSVTGRAIHAPSSVRDQGAGEKKAPLTSTLLVGRRGLEPRTRSLKGRGLCSLMQLHDTQ